MKKYTSSLSSICGGVLAFMFAACPALFIAISGSPQTDLSGWSLLLNKGGAFTGEKGFVFYRVTTIIMLAVAGLLVVWGLLTLLRNRGFFKKAKLNFTLVNNILLSVFALTALLSLIAAYVLAGESGTGYTTGAGVGAWYTLAIACVGCTLSWIFARKD